MITLKQLSGAVILSLAVSASMSAVPALSATISLTGTVRDFSDAHPDFESTIGGYEPGLVEATLGSDRKPVRSSKSSNQTTAFGDSPGFYDWYHDTPHNSGKTSYSITLDNAITSDPNVFTYYNSSFFPIDGRLGGNQGRSHNYHFTYEIHSSFTYQGSETFSFSGDDDLWVFINDQLVIDLGGVHGALSASVSLDTLGLNLGEVYNFDLFFAERHTSASNFRVDTSIMLQQPPPQDVPAPATLAIVGLGLVALGWFRRNKLI